MTDPHATPSPASTPTRADVDRQLAANRELIRSIRDGDRDVTTFLIVVFWLFGILDGVVVTWVVMR